MQRCMVLVCLFLSVSAACGQAYADKPSYKRIERLRLLADDVGLPLSDGADLLDLNAYTTYRKSVHDWVQKKEEAPKDGTRTDAATKRFASSLLPSFGEKLLRSTQLQSELIQQPNTVLIQDSTTGIVKPQQNPDHWLLRLSAITTYGAFVSTPEDISNKAATLKAAGIEMDGRMLCGGSPSRLKDCFLRIGPMNRMSRFIAASKVTFTYGQNPVVFQSIAVPSYAAAKNLSVSGKIEFDPKSVFISGTDWSTASETAKIFGKDGLSSLNSAAGKRCGLLAQAADLACSSKLAGPSTGKALLESLVPQLSLALRNQFDFVKSGGTLVQAPFPTAKLWDITVTTDLSHLIPSPKMRADGVKAWLALKNAKQPEDDMRSAAGSMAIDLATDPDRVNDDVWYQKFRALLLALASQRDAAKEN